MYISLKRKPEINRHCTSNRFTQSNLESSSKRLEAVTRAQRSLLKRSLQGQPEIQNVSDGRFVIDCKICCCVILYRSSDRQMTTQRHRDDT